MCKPLYVVKSFNHPLLKTFLQSSITLILTRDFSYDFLLTTIASLLGDCILPPPHNKPVLGPKTRFTAITRPACSQWRPSGRPLGPLHCVLAFFDPLLYRAAVVVEPYDPPWRPTQARHDEAHPREQLEEALEIVATEPVPEPVKIKPKVLRATKPARGGGGTPGQGVGWDKESFTALESAPIFGFRKPKVPRVRCKECSRLLPAGRRCGRCDFCKRIKARELKRKWWHKQKQVHVEATRKFRLIWANVYVGQMGVVFCLPYRSTSGVKVSSFGRLEANFGR